MFSRECLRCPSRIIPRTSHLQIKRRFYHVSSRAFAKSGHTRNIRCHRYSVHSTEDVPRKNTSNGTRNIIPFTGTCTQDIPKMSQKSPPDITQRCPTSRCSQDIPKMSPERSKHSAYFAEYFPALRDIVDEWCLREGDGLAGAEGHDPVGVEGFERLFHVGR